MKSLPNSVSRKAFALVAISDPSRVDDFLSAAQSAATTPTRILNLCGKRCNKARRPFDQAYPARRTDTFLTITTRGVAGRPNSVPQCLINYRALIPAVAARLLE